MEYPTVTSGIMFSKGAERNMEEEEEDSKTTEDWEYVLYACLALFVILFCYCMYDACCKRKINSARQAKLNATGPAGTANFIWPYPRRISTDTETISISVISSNSNTTCDLPPSYNEVVTNSELYMTSPTINRQITTSEQL
ncbi:hypothetical protein SNE40_015451 [Patella caerulea]|uniref:Uncharacterized protein n=1 Tax=Patella caerulea TaxID=87958 RepID=A0AAN8PKZ2_PATCE